MATGLGGVAARAPGVLGAVDLDREDRHSGVEDDVRPRTRLRSAADDMSAEEWTAFLAHVKEGGIPGLKLVREARWCPECATADLARYAVLTAGLPGRCRCGAVTPFKQVMRITKEKAKKPGDDDPVEEEAD